MNKQVAYKVEGKDNCSSRNGKVEIIATNPGN